MELHYTLTKSPLLGVLLAGIRISMGLFLSLSTQAQVVVPALSSLPELYQQRYVNTIRLARQKGWPLDLRFGTHKTASLQRIDALGHPVYYSTHGSPLSIGTHTTALYEGGGLGLALTGSSEAVNGKIALWDGGLIRSNHRELSGKIKQEDQLGGSIFNDHATHMAGIMVGKGLNASATGMAFGATLRAWDFDNDLSEIIRQAPGLLLSNHAYGPIAGWVLNPGRPGDSNEVKWEWWGTPSVHEELDYRFGFYDETTSELDRIATNFPYYLMVRSADNKRSENGPPPGTKYYLKNTSVQSSLARSPNDGYDIIPSDATAKNILTIGSADRLEENYSVAPYSGWGPTDDGRIKPDLLGIGSQVLSSLSKADDSYGVLSGTSMASANVSGSLVLLQELYHQQKGTFMLASTLKGLVLHTAEKPRGEAGPTYEYGWGLLNAEQAAKVILNTQGRFLLDEKVLSQGSTSTYTLIASGNEPLIVTLCWTDPEALPTAVSTRNVNSRAPKLINDLDILLREGFNTYQPWTLQPDAPRQKARPGDNNRDNVEQIYLANPLAGRSYTLTISHKEKLKNGRQPFSLVASGIAQPDCAQGALLTPGRDTTLCPGQSLVLSAAAGSGLLYEWLLNGQVVSQGTERTLEVNTPGSYTVRVTAPGCSALSKAIRIERSGLFADISQKGKQVACTSQGLALTANSGSGYTYQWLHNDAPISGAVSPTYQATQTGAYRVQVTHQGCTLLSKITEVEVSPLSATLDPAVSATLCNGAPALLKAPQQQGVSYVWFFNNTPLTNATGAQYQATSPGRYAVEVRNGSCTNRSKDVVVNKVDVKAAIDPPTSTVISRGGSIILQASHTIGNRYTWYRNDTLLPAETAPLLKATRAGSYKVAVENTGCRAESPPLLLVADFVTALSSPGIPGDSTTFMKVYPNPAQEAIIVSISSSESSAATHATLLTLSGQALLSQPLRMENELLKARFDITMLPRGTYLVRITAGNHSYTQHFLKF